MRNVPAGLVSLACALLPLLGCGPEPALPIVSLPPATSPDHGIGQLGQELLLTPRTAGALDVTPRTAGALDVTPRTAGALDGRPYRVRVPSRYDRTKPTPLVIMLHGFSASADLEELYLNLSPLAESRTFLYAYPDGTQNPLGLRFWNSQEWCCDFFKSGVNDVAYVGAILDDLVARYNVDKKRVYVIGHSNGGFMAHRLACELSGRIAAVVSLAGSQQNDPTRCLPKEPVSVLQVHGTLDVIISMGGSGGLYPSAVETQSLWATRNGCTGRLTYSGENRDLDAAILGAETRVEQYTGCPAAGAVELWSIQGGSHVPLFTPHFAEGIYSFFMAHPKP